MSILSEFRVYSHVSRDNRSRDESCFLSESLRVICFEEYDGRLCAIKSEYPHLISKKIRLNSYVDSNISDQDDFVQTFSLKLGSF
ncbi:hypothetical protein BpHYR1_014789 [Brachionus plicatilis]|uniref:Uncharacterized protein n=1 Tax=Brachionus plicatilis TaxID=10195 RepID=A0A3M7PFQ5_BRAPC|nr:hypothetical protein BpHYR1_014789 [Brachionus plicatilis]